MAIAPFKTPPNEKSFSGLVDAVIAQTGKTQGLSAAVSYANMTVRECQAFGLFARDLVEDVAVADSSPFIWTRPPRFRSLRAAKYSTQMIYPKLKLIGRQIERASWYFYSADDYYAFHGVMLNEQIALAMYMWAKPLYYFTRLGTEMTPFFVGQSVPDPRDAYYDDKNEQWLYLGPEGKVYVPQDVVGIPDAEAETRRNYASNWLILEWWDMILEGTKAKLLKQFNDDRAPISFSLYSKQQELFRTVTVDAEVSSVDQE